MDKSRSLSFLTKLLKSLLEMGMLVLELRRVGFSLDVLVGGVLVLVLQFLVLLGLRGDDDDDDSVVVVVDLEVPNRLARTDSTPKLAARRTGFWSCLIFRRLALRWSTDVVGLALSRLADFLTLFILLLLLLGEVAPAPPADNDVDSSSTVMPLMGSRLKASASSWIFPDKLCRRFVLPMNPPAPLPCPEGLRTTVTPPPRAF